MPERYKIRIAVLEDNKTTLMLIDQAFKKASILNYTLFEDTKVFLKTIDATTGIVVIDYILNGEMDGLDVCKEVRRRNRNCYIIAISAQSDMNIVIEFMNIGGSKKYVQKTGNWIENLVDFVHEAIEEKRRDVDFYMELENRAKKFKNEK